MRMILASFDDCMGSEMTSDDLLNVRAAATRLGVHRSYLDRRRTAGGGPTFIRLSARKIAYRRGDLDAWLAGLSHASTSQYDAQAKA